MNKKLLRKKLALMLANLKKKRKYYVECEYLESTGTQYIDTGVKATNKTKAIVKSVGMTWVFGGRTSVSYGDAFGVCLGQNVAYLQFGNQSITYSKTNIKNDILLLENSQDGCYVNGVKQATYNTQTFTGTHNIYLFNLNDNDRLNDGLIGKIWFSKIYEDGVLVRDLIPVLDWSGVPCMYDRVTEQLFYNQGTGSFVAGRQIHPVEYLESTGTQYINTGYIPNTNTYVELNAMYTALDSTYRTPFSVRAYDGAANSFTIAGATNVANVYAFGSQYWSGDNGCPIAYTNVKYFMSLKTGVAIFNGVTGNAGTTITPSNLTAYMFARNSNGTASNFFIGRIYDCQLKDNGVLVRDYIPAISEDGTSFMFDRVSHTIYDNAGTGAFKYPAREVEYLESSGTQYINTLFNGKSGLKTVCKFNFTELTTNVSNAIGGEYKPYAGCYIGMVRTNGKFAYHYYNTTIEGTTASINTDYVLESYMYPGEQYLMVNGVKIATSTMANSFTSDVNIWLFGMNISGGVPFYSKMKMYYCQIYDNDTLVRDFIPCYKDGALGMWDKANNVFYPNAGTGTFTAGKIVESLYE